MPSLSESNNRSDEQSKKVVNADDTEENKVLSSEFDGLFQLIVRQRLALTILAVAFVKS